MTLSIQQRFQDMFGAAPVGVWSAPGRVNLIGEHSDYNGGLTLPFAIDQRTSVAVGHRIDGRLRVVSTAFGDSPESIAEVAISELDQIFAQPHSIDPARAGIPAWAAYPLGVAWSLLSRAQPRGLNLLFDSTVALGAGLSSSAAIECATAVALNELWDLDLSRLELAQAGQWAENEAVGAPTGIMDQLASLFGQPGHAVLLDCRDLTVDPVPLSFDEHGLCMLVIDTGIRHSHATGGFGERRAACERGAQQLGVPLLREVSEHDLDEASAKLDPVTFRRVRHVVTEIQRVRETVQILREGGPKSIGQLLLASHVSLRDDFEVSIPQLDLAVESAMTAGAVGARMTGGGFGGAAIALVSASQTESVTHSVTQAFEAAGFAPPHVFAVEPSESARRDA